MRKPVLTYAISGNVVGGFGEFSYHFWRLRSTTEGHQEQLGVKSLTPRRSDDSRIVGKGVGPHAIARAASTSECSYFRTRPSV